MLFCLVWSTVEMTATLPGGFDDAAQYTVDILWDSLDPNRTTMVRYTSVYTKGNLTATDFPLAAPLMARYGYYVLRVDKITNDSRRDTIGSEYKFLSDPGETRILVCLILSVTSMWSLISAWYPSERCGSKK